MSSTPQPRRRRQAVSGFAAPHTDPTALQRKVKRQSLVRGSSRASLASASSSRASARVLPPDEWVPDAESNQCSNCGSQFSFFKRRHHCRLCGKVFCASCTNHRITVHDTSHVRVCNLCYDLEDVGSDEDWTDPTAADLLRGRDGVVPEDTVVPDSDIGDVPAGSVQPPSKSPPPPIIAARAVTASAAAAATAAVAHPAPAAAPVASKELATTRVARRSIAWLQWVSTTMRQVASWQHIWLSGLVCALWIIAMLYTSLAISLAHCAALWLLFKRYGALKLQAVPRDPLQGVQYQLVKPNTPTLAVASHNEQVLLQADSASGGGGGHRDENESLQRLYTMLLPVANAADGWMYLVEWHWPGLTLVGGAVLACSCMLTLIVSLNTLLVAATLLPLLRRSTLIQRITDWIMCALASAARKAQTRWARAAAAS